MTKEELIKELVKSRINEARLKKGYEVKGVGVKRWEFKEVVSIIGKNALQIQRQKQKLLQTISFFFENTI